MKNMRSSFTLLELIFAIVIISVLASVAIPKFFNTTTDAKVSTLKRDITTITTSLQSYYVINSKIDKISQAINFNTKIWEQLDDKSIVYKEDSKECIKIEVLNQNSQYKIQLTINSQAGSICKKLNDDGIVDTIYELD
jgi:general secretion pathway protein G